MTITIAVASHKPYWIPDDDVYLPIQVGAAGKESIEGFQRDDVGDNISAKNQNYCELTGLYWIWKHVKADYIGLVHYRRYFEEKSLGKKENRIASGDFLARMLNAHGVLLPVERNYLIETTYSQYIHAHNKQDLDVTRCIISEFWPSYLEAFDSCMTRTHGHRFNMFIMKYDLFDSYCSWLFDILFKLEEKLDISNYSDNDARVFGFVSERLLDVWIQTNGISYGSLPVVHLEGENWIPKGAAFIKRKLQGEADSSTKESGRKEPGDTLQNARDDLEGLPEQPLVSIIVPVYNIADCVEHCFDSLRQQTYASIEILFVDDGSTDGSGALLDSFASVDSRVVVLHKENGGLSSARNYGIQRAAGLYSVYVDGDDYVAPSMVEELLSATYSTSCEIAIGTAQTVSQYGVPFNDINAPVLKQDSRDASVTLLYGRPGVSGWCKLAKTEFWKNHLFDEGHVYEDLRMMFQTISCCDVVAIVTSRLYAYVMRPGSITSERIVSEKQIEDYVDAINSVRDCFAGTDDYELQQAVKCRLANEYARLYRHVYHRRQQSERYDAICNHIVRYERNNMVDVVSDPSVDKITKLRVAMLSLSPSLYVPAFYIASRAKGKRLK